MNLLVKGDDSIGKSNRIEPNVTVNLILHLLFTVSSHRGESSLVARFAGRDTVSFTVVENSFRSIWQIS